MLSIDPRTIKPANVEQATGVYRNGLLAGYGALAPSSHNSQPWRFRIGTEGIDVLADRSRALPVVDPDDRELIISCGAAIESIVIAARYYGLTATVSMLDDPDAPDDLVRLDILPYHPADQKEVSRFHGLRSRRTTRTAFEDYQPTAELLGLCRASAPEFDVEFLSVLDAGIRSKIADLVARGDQIQFHDPAFRNELAKWVHSESLGERDGMSGAGFGMPDILAGLARFAIRTFDMGKGVAAADRQKIVDGSPVLAVLATEADNQSAWLRTGRALMRTLADITAHGLTASYLNQPIEVPELRATLGEIAGVRGAPQILLRIGRTADTARPSARRLISDVVEIVG